MFSQDQLQKGDIMLSFHKDSLVSEMIANTTNSKWSHALLYIGDNQILESTQKGVYVGKLSKYQKDKVYIMSAYRLKDATPEQLDRFVACALERVGKRYGFFQVGYLWLLYLTGRIKDKYWQRDVDAGEDCSEVIARALQKADMSLFDKNPSVVIPNDYAICDKLERIL